MPLGQFVFNETTPAAAGTAASSQSVQNAANYLSAGIAGPLDDFSVIDVLAEVVGATGGTLDIYLQVSPDEGLTWMDKIHFPQLAGGASAINYHASISEHPQATSDATIVVGINLTPVLALNTVVQGLGFNRARLLFVAGTGTSAGAAIKVILSLQKAS